MTDTDINHPLSPIDLLQAVKRNDDCQVLIYLVLCGDADIYASSKSIAKALGIESRKLVGKLVKLKKYKVVDNFSVPNIGDGVL